MLRKGYKEVTDVTQTVGSRHPLVRTDAKTGRKALFLGRRPNAYVIGTQRRQERCSARRAVGARHAAALLDVP